MKRLIALIACTAFLAAQAQTNNCDGVWLPGAEQTVTYNLTAPPAPGEIQPQSQLLVCFVVLVAIGCGYVYWKVRSCYPSDSHPETFVLEKTHDGYEWIPLQTNTVTLHGTNPITFFQVQIDKDRNTDDFALYRARWVRPVR